MFNPLQYLIVQLWTLEFNPLQPFPRNVMVWVRLPSLSGLFYKQKNLEETGGLISKVTKHDFQTNTGARGKFIRMAVFFDMGNPLISNIHVDGKLQKVEFESLPTVCFTCGRSSHVQESYPVAGLKSVDGVVASPSLASSSKKQQSKETSKTFDP
ncbi:hypothetical protein Gogos_018162 [Gossypium gossypioides]|uniref:DUF4283 domain-containing protein n=1 Tax=Gossypium gossypioides TaxID=34282 RepID=A0A7J9BCZ7_GOSGO|nr:hypothetical protein [Gossypium gossypioides]